MEKEVSTHVETVLGLNLDVIFKCTNIAKEKKKKEEDRQASISSSIKWELANPVAQLYIQSVLNISHHTCWVADGLMHLKFTQMQIMCS